MKKQSAIRYTSIKVPKTLYEAIYFNFVVNGNYSSVSEFIRESARFRFETRKADKEKAYYAGSGLDHGEYSQ